MSEQKEKAPDLINEMAIACEEPSRGRIFVLMGPNSAGKTRFLQSIGGRFGEVNARTLYLRSDRVLRGNGDVRAEANANPDILSKMLDQEVMRLISHQHSIGLRNRWSDQIY